jgi:hypothetical protein
MSNRRHIVHIINGGAQALCGTVKGTPRAWPHGHKWVPLKDADKATCKACIEAAKERACK